VLLQQHWSAVYLRIWDFMGRVIVAPENLEGVDDLLEDLTVPVLVFRHAGVNVDQFLV